MTTGARRGWFGLWLGVAATAAALAAAAGGWRRPDARLLLERAQADYQAGRYGRAESGLAQLARLRDPTPMDRMARALVAEALGRGEAALAELARIGGDDPLVPLAELRAGRIERNRANLRRAEGHFLAALGRDPTLAQARNELAYIYNVQLRLDEMDAQMDALSRLDALGFDSLLHWSKTRNVTWNPASDCEALARSVAADPGDRRSRLALADGLRQLGRRDEADAILAPLPASDPEGLRPTQHARHRPRRPRAGRAMAVRRAGGPRGPGQGPRPARTAATRPGRGRASPPDGDGRRPE